MDIKITSLNLFAFEDWENRKIPILEYLHKENSDVVVFQEVVFLPDVSPFNQVQLLNQQLHYPFELNSVTRLQRGLTYPIYREGLGVTSKYPIKSSDTIILKQAQGDEHQRIVQLFDIQIGHHIIKIAHVHFSITDYVDFATAHLVETLAILEARGEKRIIIGDFNLTHLEESQGLWGDEYRASTAKPYITYPSMNKRTDYALIPNEYSFVDITVSPDGLSDHRALTVTLRIQ